MVYMTLYSNLVSTKNGGLNARYFCVIMVLFLMFFGIPSRSGVKCEHGDLGSVSFHLRRKTKSHGHRHKHLKAVNKTHFALGIGRSKDGFSLRVWICQNQGRRGRGGGRRGHGPSNFFETFGFLEILKFRAFAVGKGKSFEFYRKIFELGPRNLQVPRRPWLEFMFFYDIRCAVFGNGSVYALHIL